MKIERLPSGTYRARVYIGRDSNGKAKYKSITDKDKARLRIRIAEISANKPKTHGNASTVGESVAAYIDARAAVLSPATIRGYLTIYRALKTDHRSFFKSGCGDADIQALISDMIRLGKSPKTVRNTASLVNSSIKYAGYSPAACILPARQKPRYHIPTEDEIKTLLRSVKDTPLDIAVQLGICGLRRSEICGITADDVNGCTLHIQRALVKNPSDGWIIKGTKTYSSDRYIIITREISDYITDNGYAYGSVPTALSENFAKAIKRAGLPHFRFHDLRHFFASYAHNVLKLSDKQIQQLGGWRSNYTLQSVYEHSMNDEEAGEAVALALGKLNE